MSLGFTFHLPGYFPSFNSSSLTKTVETSFIATTLYPIFYKHTVVEFKVPAHWGSCAFDVYRAEAEFGPWEKVTPTQVIGNFFKDTGSRAFSKEMPDWYIVECELPDGRKIQGPPTTWQNVRRNWVEIRAKEVERRSTLLLEKFTGVKTMLFRRRHFGARCPECWDFATEKATKDHCKTCLGTSFKGGFYPGFETLFQYDSRTEDAIMDERGRVENNVISAWTISYPQVEEFDLVLRVPDFRLFRVEKVQNTELQTVPVRQIMLLNELSKGSIEFELAKQALPSAYR